MARLLCIIVIALELRGIWIAASERGWLPLLAYYTQISNILATVASVLLVALGQPNWITALRYTSVCMLVMTAAVTVLVLVPMGGDPHKLLWSGNGIYHHVLCPAISTASYVLFEQHAPVATLALPVAITLVYGLVMLWLNARRVVDGPYPFFRVHNQSKLATVMWILVLLAAVSLISGLVLVVVR